MTVRPTFSKGYPPAPIQGQGAATESAPLRGNLDGLWVNNYTEDEDYPLNPDAGASRVLASDPSNIRFQMFIKGAWRTIANNLQSGTIPTILRASFTVPSATWTVVHNMANIVLVQCWDNSNPRKLFIPGDVQLVLSGTPSDYNTLVITHDSALAGHVIIMG